jgi:hypothetical protein
MVWVGLATILGDVRRWSESPGVGGRPDRCPERLGAEVIRGGAPAPPLRSVGLCLSMVPSLNGVTNIAVITDSVVHGGTLRGKLTPLLLLGPSAPGPWVVGATAGRVTTTPAHRWGMSFGVILVGSGRCLGWSGEHNTMPRSRALGLMLERHGEAALTHVATCWSSGPACRRCPLAGRQRPPCCRLPGEAQGAGSPHTGVVVLARRLHDLLPCKVLPLVLDLCINGLQVHLSSLEASSLLPKVVRTAAGTLV